MKTDFGKITSSNIIKELESADFKINADKNLKFEGELNSYSVGFCCIKNYMNEKLRSYIWIKCNIPFVGQKGGARKIRAFSKEFKPQVIHIDSPTGFSKFFKTKELLVTDGKMIINYMEQLVEIAEGKKFNPLIKENINSCC